MFTGDNLEILRGINDACIDLIYLDPPFNSNHNYAAPIGSEAAGAEFKDTWTLNDIDVAWHGMIAEETPDLYKIIDATMRKSDKAYLIYMAVRLMEMRRILKETGSIYLHCDPTMSHWLKIVLDAIFGKENFRNEIVWHYTNASRGKFSFAKAHDIVLWYSRGEDYIFNRKEILVPFSSGMTKWRYTKGGQEGKPMPKGKTPDDVISMPSLNAMAKERTGYPTQKPLALLERIIKASSNRDDIVLDPFAGCATACIAAQKLVRDWIGIDISETANRLVRERIVKDLDLFGINVNHRTDIPKRTDIEKLPHYRTHKHILYGEQEGFCNGCREHTQIKLMHVDHKVPRSKGGTDHIENLQLLCAHCNSRKGSKSQEEFLSILKAEGII